MKTGTSDSRYCRSIFYVFVPKLDDVYFYLPQPLSPTNLVKTDNHLAMNHSRKHATAEILYRFEFSLTHPCTSVKGMSDVVRCGSTSPDSAGLNSILDVT